MNNLPPLTKRFGPWQIGCSLIFGTLLIGALLDQSYRSLIVESTNNDVWYLSLFWGFVFMLFLMGFAILLERNGKEARKKPTPSKPVDPNFYIVRGHRIIEDEDGNLYRYDLNEDEVPVAIYKKVGKKPYRWQRLPDTVMLDFAKPGSKMHICDTVIEDPNQIRAIQPYSSDEQA